MTDKPDYWDETADGPWDWAAEMALEMFEWDEEGAAPTIAAALRLVKARAKLEGMREAAKMLLGGDAARVIRARADEIEKGSA